MNERIRVLLFIKGLGLGGAERLLERAVPYLDRRRFDYQVAYLLPWKDALVEPFRAVGIPVHCLEFRRIVDVGVLSRVVALLRRERIDLIHAHLPLPGVLARLARRRAGVRWMVYTEHSLPSRHRFVTRALNAATYRMNDAVIAVSQAVATQARRYLRGSHTRLVVIPNGIDAVEFKKQAADHEGVCREFGFPPDALVVIHVGNLRPVKGHRYLLAAARQVVDQEPRARFLLVGTGPLAGQLQGEARGLGLDGYVTFAGFRADATALLGGADLFVLSSLDEGLPVSLLEAMALGRPAVATRVGGIPEVVLPGETAVLVDPMDAAALAAGMLDLLRDPERRGRMGAAARGHVSEQYGMARMVAAVEDVYGQVTGR